MTDLDGRVVVITGGNGGIGLGMAHGVAAAGAAVAVWGRDEAKNDAAVEALRAAGAVASSVVVDVADEAAVDAAMAQTLAVHGRVDTMIANAGIGGGAPFVDQTLEQWRRVMAVSRTLLSRNPTTRGAVRRADAGRI